MAGIWTETAVDSVRRDLRALIGAGMPVLDAANLLRDRMQGDTPEGERQRRETLRWREGQRRRRRGSEHARKCKCGCGESVAGKRWYMNEECRQRHLRRKLRGEDA